MNGVEATKALAGKTVRPRPIHIIAREMRDVSPQAASFQNAMFSLTHVSDMYGLNPGRPIVEAFLDNAGAWQGETADRIKAELKALLIERKS